MGIWLTMIVSGIMTYAMRLSSFVAFGQGGVPPGLKRALRYVPPAVLTAIIFPELLMPGGELNISLDNTRLLAGLIAVLVAWRTKNTVLTIMIGLLALWFLQWLL